MRLSCTLVATAMALMGSPVLAAASSTPPTALPTQLKMQLTNPALQQANPCGPAHPGTSSIINVPGVGDVAVDSFSFGTGASMHDEGFVAGSSRTRSNAEATFVTEPGSSMPSLVHAASGKTLFPTVRAWIKKAGVEYLELVLTDAQITQIQMSPPTAAKQTAKLTLRFQTMNERYCLPPKGG